MNLFSSNNNYENDPDVQLMLAVQKGDQASFEKLMEKYYRRIFNFLYRFLGNKQAAEDLTQEVFIRIYRHASRYRPAAKFQTWAFRIAKNAALNELRTQKKVGYSLDAPIITKEGEMTREVADEKAHDALEDMEKKERAEFVKKAIDELPENQRMAVLFRRYEQLSYEDIARSMNCSTKAVKSLLSRAKENLKDKLTRLIKGYH